MAENSKIEWTNHTFNPWVGCTKVSPGCDHCYAESWAKRAGNPQLWTGARRRTTPANWAKVLKWDAAAKKAGRVDRVFCASLADVFDNEVPQQWRTDLFELIRLTPHLRWLLLTKRIGNAISMLPEDWGAGYPNVMLGSTIVNQPEADRDAWKLLATPAAGHFFSIEPMLGPIDLNATPPEPGRIPINGAILDDLRGCLPKWQSYPIRAKLRDGVDWVIAGGESGGNARPMHPQWARQLRDACVTAGVPFFFKQWGEWAELPCQHAIESVDSCVIDRRKVAVGQIDSTWIFRGGKRFTGREIDGRTWDEIPTSHNHGNKS